MVKQESMKIYWWSFGITIGVLAITGILYLMFAGGNAIPSTFDESELPSLPAENEEVQGQIEFPGLPIDTNEQEVEEGGNIAAGTSTEEEFVGAWKLYSERLFYDEGGGGSTLSASSGTASTQKLFFNADGSWEYGSSKGKWIVADILPEDWIAWKIDSFESTRKIILDGWNKGSASGPIEESGGNVDFVWVLYRTEPPTTSKPGTVNMKFGH